MELLYLPVSPASRKRLKLFIDVFIDRLGRFAAALVILAITLGVQAGASRLRWTAAVAVALSAAAFGCCLHLRRSYSEAFRQQLSRRELEPDELGRFVTDPASVRLLRDALRGTHDRQRLYALRLSQSVRGADLSPEILPLLEHPSAEVRAEAVRAGQSLPAAHRDRIERLLGDPVAPVRTAAVEYLCGAVSSGAEPPLARLFTHPDPTIRLAAARWLADSPVVEVADVQARIAELLDVEGPRSPEARAVAARLAGRLEPTASIATLRRLLADPDPGVVAATAQAAGAAGHLELLFEIVPLLGDRTRRAAAREALVRYGPRAVGTLSDLVADPGRDPAIRREIPWVLARIATRRSADALTELIGTEDVLLKYRAVKGLNRMHESHPELPVARTDIARHLRGQIRQYYEALLRWQAFQPEIHERRLLVRALKERLDHDLEVIFRLLGLLYPQKDIYFAYTAVRDGRADRRGAAIEFLDTLLDRDFKRLVLPLLEEASADRLAERAMAAFGIQPKSAEDALEVILERSDTWLRACALHEIGERRLRQLRSRLESLAADREPLLRETARWALLRCGGDVGAQGGARAC